MDLVDTRKHDDMPVYEKCMGGQSTQIVDPCAAIEYLPKRHKKLMVIDKKADTIRLIYISRQV